MAQPLMQYNLNGLVLVARAPPHHPVTARPRRGHGAQRSCSRLHAGSNGASPPAPALTSSVVTDAAVPEAHAGLHSFLYGEGGAEAHDAPPAAASSGGSGYAFREGEDDGTALVDVVAYVEDREGERPVGVFAVYDVRRNLQYVSYSRNVVLALRGMRTRVGEERCAFVRAMVFANKAMQTRSALAREAQNWIAEAGTTPPGNGAEAELWEGGAALDTAAMSPDELVAYEEKKLKMQKAMGEKVSAEGGANGEDEDVAERRAKMIAAMDGGDWSAVIDGQTKEAVDGGAAPATKQVTTPFARASVHRSVGANAPTAAAALSTPMTMASVDAALDDVRPYLIADGGNVEVASVENGIVLLQLQGACGTCPSSSATMKMGIERALRAAFGDQLKEVLQVGGALDTSASVAAVDAHLDMLRGAVAAYGGSVEVVSVGGGIAELRYKGPKPIGYGLVAAIKDKFPDVRRVDMVDAETGEPIKF